jgi:hypothetical protein
VHSHLTETGTPNPEFTHEECVLLPLRVWSTETLYSVILFLLQTRYVRVEFDDDEEGEISRCLENSSRPQEFVLDDKVLARKVRIGSPFSKESM